MTPSPHSNPHYEQLIAGLPSDEDRAWLDGLVEQFEAHAKEKSAAVDAANHWHYKAKRLEEQFEAMRDFLVELIRDEWNATPPYNEHGSFAPVNQWISPSATTREPPTRIRRPDDPFA